MESINKKAYADNIEELEHRFSQDYQNHNWPLEKSYLFVVMNTISPELPFNIRMDSNI